MSEMRAVGFTESGDASVLRLLTLPVPEPGPGQVRVHVAAATVNPTDIGLRMGMRPPDAAPPFIPGMELAGVIDTVGPGVSGWAAGDRVLAAVSPREPGGGAQAEYR
ncbi:MAG: alcohol dehydrogenase catalytic domain-containing protein, partial [Actinobacteria bacterium]|nr:alcohol dehydrogenase catalytic domain-containing protein [Actinomycetota bacterium]